MYSSFSKRVEEREFSLKSKEKKKEIWIGILDMRVRVLVFLLVWIYSSDFFLFLWRSRVGWYGREFLVFKI